MKIRSLALLLALVMLLLTGCGSNSVTSAPMEMEYAEDMAETTNGSVSLAGSGSTTESASLPEGRKWIVTVNMTAETEDMDALLEELNQRIASLGGYVEDQRIYNGSIHSNRRYRYADLTIRVPAEDVNAFTEDVKSISNIVSSEENRDDVTLSYVATESRVNALKAEEARLLELMEQAENMTDLLEIEERLTEVRYELERYASQLRTYDNQIDYATIYLNIEEVQKLTPVEEPTTWERITEGFGESVESLQEGIVNTFVWVVVNSPYLGVWAVVILAAVLITKTIRKRKAAKKIPPKEPENKTE
ncbi:MAG: DUF4349 domain-containing protein [Oscillospiraceae bacterium]|nr:DUF4349 domain-containing protein [Oscillospiraceae bacterium]